ncbi:putative late blight resistance protein homolog R1A-10 [Solanum stenotomum]|uniref:putative late blight resistance protein homolog R1A-10 n=1 Tax=Solanum stenotomum TaxID=172797 RepID=UPI0020D1E374|nr:putative late blight resistance protein homolog R1A-10 [Solanum stenotomum]
MVFRSRHNFCREVKTCKIHDLLHELCLREAQSENFMFVSPHSRQVCPKECYRTIVQSICDFDGTISYPFDPKKIRTFIYSGEMLVKDLNIDRLFGFRILSLMRVMSLGNLSYHLGNYPIRPSYFVHLRYLSLEIRNRPAFPHIPKLHNLQSLIVHMGSSRYDYSFISLDISMLPQLRSLHFVKKRGPSFPLIMLSVQMKHTVLEHLHTVTGVPSKLCTNEIFANMPNLKKLGIQYDEEHGIKSPSSDLSCLLVAQGLEKNIFPPTLKKLTLVRPHFPWEATDIVGTILPYLEALKLKNYACAGDEWKPVAGGFSLLKFLSLECIRFTKWIATDENFPVLERLSIAMDADDQIVMRSSMRIKLQNLWSWNIKLVSKI